MGPEDELVYSKADVENSVLGDAEQSGSHGMLFMPWVCANGPRKSPRHKNRVVATGFGVGANESGEP